MTLRFSSESRSRTAWLRLLGALVIACAVQGRLPAQEKVGCCTDSAAAAALLEQAGNAYRASPMTRASMLHAMAFFVEAARVARRGRAAGIEEFALYNISRIQRQIGATDSALHFAEELVRASRRNGDSLGVAFGFFALAEVYAEVGRPDSVLAVSNDAFRLCAAIRSCFFINQLFAVALPYAAGGDSAARVLRRLVSNSLAQRDTVGMGSALGGIRLCHDRTARAVRLRAPLPEIGHRTRACHPRDSLGDGAQLPVLGDARLSPALLQPSPARCSSTRGPARRSVRIGEHRQDVSPHFEARCTRLCRHLL